MMNGKRWCLWVLAGWLLCGHVWAVQVEGLYDAEQLVTSQGQSQRIAATKRALQEVLVRVSGNRSVLDNAQVRKALAKPQDYLYQYGYEATNQPVSLSNGNTVLAKRLTIQFQPSAINRLLQESGLPVWGSNRPSVLMWMALDGRTGRQVVNSDTEHPAVNALWNYAEKRGLPLVLPLMDLEDERTVGVSDVWGLFEDRIRSASRRYQPDSALAGRVYPLDGGGWAGTWILLVKGETISFKARAGDMDSYMAEVIDQAAAHLAQRYAVVDGAGRDGSVRLHIQGVNSTGHYAAALDYLKTLAPVESVLVSQVNEQELVFTLLLRGQARQLEAVIDLDHKLAPISGLNLAGQSKAGALYYRWMGR